MPFDELIQVNSVLMNWWQVASETELVEAFMTNIPAGLHKTPAIPEPWRWRDTIQFTVWGLLLFTVLFAFMFSLGNM